MDQKMPRFRPEELASLRLRALFEESGYHLFRQGSFEEYDLYMQNRSFLRSDEIITFTSSDGKLMALKPDVTLSIAKNTMDGELRRVYYNEHVFRKSRKTKEYREIAQMGIELIGGGETKSEGEVLRLAVQSLEILGGGVLDLSHMGLVESILRPFADTDQYGEALSAVRDKSRHRLLEAAQKIGMDSSEANLRIELAMLSGDFLPALQEARALSAGLSGAKEALDELESFAALLKEITNGIRLRLDVSALGDVDYYNGILFQGFLRGAAHPVLSGGRYDNLLRRFDKTQGAVGFAIYLDEIGRELFASKKRSEWLRIALPKGRMGNEVYRLFAESGLYVDGMEEEGRKLVFEDPIKRLRYLIVKPTDVDSYVEHGVADIGVVGKDILLENDSDVLELMDLALGCCYLAAAAADGFVENLGLPLRVASKYPAVARRHYENKSRSVEIIPLHGAVELAPLTGLSDVIVDIVESGRTLQENGLSVIERIHPSSARLIANRVSYRFFEEEIRDLMEKLKQSIPSDECNNTKPNRGERDA